MPFARSPRCARGALARLLCPLFLVLIPLAPAPAPGQQAVPDTAGVVMEYGVPIPVRDGTRLNATIYRPAGAQGQLPVVLGMTPYINDVYHPWGARLAQDGFIFAAVDVRGRGGSEGDFTPFENDAKDAHDVVEWLAAQPWSNGKIATFGGSYGGFYQWSSLRERPPHLASLAPFAPGYFGLDFPALYNIFRSYDVQWLTFTSNAPAHPNLFGDFRFWAQRYYHRYVNHLPFRSLDRLVGNPSPVFQKWLDHPYMDAYWDALAPRPEDYAAIDIPILTVTGHYDGDQPGSLEYYRLHMEHGTPEATARHYLVIGPWDHGGTRSPQPVVGGVPVGPAGVLDMHDLNRAWYDWTLNDGPRPEFLKDRVAYYVMGADEWKYAPSLAAIPARPTAFYLSSRGGRANDVFASGSMAPTAPAASEPDRWVYDPLDTRFGEVEMRNPGIERYNTLNTDQTDALNLFGQGVVYHTPAFEEATEITGRPRLVVHLQMDVPDTDLWATLFEIRSDGSSILLSDVSLRARYRESSREPKPVPIGEIVRYELDDFMFFSRQIAEGSRLRLVLRSPNSIWWQKNYNSGGDVADETGADARTAHIALYHDEEHPSFLELPIVPAAARPATEQP